MTDYKSYLIGTVIISVIVILSMIVYISDQSNQIENYRKNYERGCGDGEKICVERGDTYEICSDGYFAACINEDYSYQTCKRGYKAVCIDEDKDYEVCNSNYFAACIKDDWDYTQCSLGKEAVCAKEGVYAIYNGKYIYECNIGQTAYCQD